MTDSPPSYFGIRSVTNRLFSFRDRAADESGPIATAVGSVLSPGQLLEGSDGFRDAVAVCDALEGHLTGVLSGVNGLRHLAAIRHINPGVWGSRPYLHAATRSIAELSVHRWAEFAPDPAIPFEPPEFSEAEMALIESVLAAAEAYATLMVIRRRVAKGQPVTVLSCAPLVIDISNNDGRIADLITLRDDRVQANSNLMAQVAGVLPDVDDVAIDGRVIASEYIPFEDIAPYFGPNPPLVGSPRSTVSGLGIQFVTPLDLVCRSGSLAFLPERTAHLSRLDDDLLPQHGFGASDIDAVLECLTAKVIEQGPPPWTFEDLGVAVVPVPTDDELAAVAAATADPNGRTLTVDSLRSAMRFLDSGLHPVPLSLPPQQLPLRQIGNAVLYDGLHLQTAPTSLWGVTLSIPVEQKLRKDFEDDVHAAIGHLGSQPWTPGRNLRRADGSLLTDADASVQIGGLLVAVDCYGAVWSPLLDEGNNSQTRNRADRVAKKLRDWQDLWGDIATNHQDLLPDGVTEVLAVVVTPGAEWIASWDEDLWLSATTPAICTVGELIDYLSQLDR